MTTHPPAALHLTLAPQDLTGSLPQRFARVVQRFPQHPAVSDETARVTYAGLNAAANRVANTLLRSGGSQNEPVALLMDHRATIVAAIVGALKAGQLYSALPPSNPLAHNQQLLDILDSRVILADAANLTTAETLAGRNRQVLPIDAMADPADAGDPDVTLSPDTLAAIHFTSGSTGMPQGIVRSHRNLLRRAQVDAGFLGIQPADVVSGLYASTFAGSIPDLFGSLLHGATLSLFDVKRHGLGPMTGWLLAGQVSLLHLNATLLRLFLDQLAPDLQFPHLRLVVPSQRLYRADVARLWPHLPSHAVVGHQYALTEAGPVTRWVVPRTASWDGDIAPAGQPVPGVDVRIVDEADNPLPAGAVGEIVVHSPFLAAGVWRDPVQTAARFQASPHADGLHSYRTGDLGRWTAAGYLELLGRRDAAVKVRGHRVVLTEVEAVLESLPEVRQAVVVATADTGSDLRLLAYVAAPAARADLAPALTQRLRQTLPDYMVPSRVIVLDQLPRLPNGKVDRRALPPASPQRPVLNTPFRPAGSALEAAIASIWAQVLGIDQVGIDDHFLALGGHSLQAAQIVNRVVQTCQVDLPLRVLFDAPTVAEMAVVVAQRRDRAADVAMALAPHAPGEPAPLSFAQERMWFVQQLAPDAGRYNSLLVFQLSGPLDVAALQRSLDTIVARHTVLHTTYRSSPEGPRAVVNPAAPVRLSLVDLRSMAFEQRRDEALRRAAAAGQQPFDLCRDLMLRSQLYQLADDEHLLAITVHRIATDGWSFRVLRRELVEIYRADRAGPTVDLPALPVQYADFATWQRQRLRGERLTRLLSYWQQRLSGMSPLVLPGDRPRPAVASQRAGTVRFQVPVETVYGLHQLAQASEVTPYVLLLSAFAVLVQRYAGQKDITIGTPVHNRNVAGLEPLIGRFANTLVLRCDLAGDPTFRTLLARIRQVVLEAYDHQEMPFEQLVEAINPARDLRQNPLVQVVFQLTSAETTTWDLGSLVLHHVPMEAGTSEFDLRLVMVEDGQNLHGSLEYACDLYDPPTIERLAGHFQVLLAGILAHPEDRLSHLPLLTAGELQHVPQLGRGPAIPYPRNRCIHELFEAQVSRAPDATALVADTQTLTYAQLNRRANQLAHRLRARGVGIEDLVAVCLPRGVDLMVALLGILKAGAAYLPLDPRDPAERLEFMLRDAGAVLVLAQTAGEPNLAGAAVPVLALDTLGDEALPAEASNPVIAVTAENLAYAMYTSGSTGRPKGVEICHRSVIRLLFGVDEAALGPDTVVVQLAPATFDAATFEIWGALLHGGRLVLAPDGPPDLAQLEALVIRRGVSTLWLTASLFNVVVDHRPALLTHVRQLLTGGEALSPRHVHQALQVLAPDACLVNGYGPTEGTTFTCCYQVPHDPTAESASIPIGRPIANTQVYVLDHHGQPLPVGVPGELCIGGDGLARGYRHRPELTAGCFVPNPFVDANHTTRLYRTGDQVRWLADGHLEFLGRLDHQVKVRGYRVELGEVEAALLRHPAVRAGAVVAEPEPAGGQRLVAHWVPGEGRAARAADLAAFLGTLLPAYMVPAQFVEHAALPLTAGGKLDRQALLAAAALPDATQSPAAPRTPLEQALAAIWAAVLPVAQVGIDDNFFALGGHSLRAVQVVARVRDQLGIDVPLRIIFEHPTVAGMAVQVQPLLDQAPPFEREEFVL